MFSFLKCTISIIDSGRMNSSSITIFTPTFNRGYILHKLYESLLRQTEYCFEWLIIDDGSSDNTEDLVQDWIKSTTQFQIRYYKTSNGGKPRAINKAVELAKTPYLFIVDSDDFLLDNTMEFLSQKVHEIKNSNEVAAVGILRGKSNLEPLKFPLIDIDSFVDATNLERKKYGLDFDCNEVYKIDVLKKYPFRVWEGEFFSPEEIVFNEIALQGYKVRWYNKVGVISEYLNDGLTINANNLIKKNPMGYAMCFNHQLKYKKSFFERFQLGYLIVCYVLLGKNLGYLSESNDKLITFLSFPVGCIVAMRRLYQFKSNKF